ncbi:MAG: hypothetical protein J6K29_08600 [Clostridia bacterium]|nr:hypothetical protein [Clostridia bacterium]MBP3667096.1 hypothetical protein [Clostridia bacterium]
MKKLLIVTLLALAVALTVAACTEDPVGSDTTADSTGAGNPTEASSETSFEEPTEEPTAEAATDDNATEETTTEEVATEEVATEEVTTEKVTTEEVTTEEVNTDASETDPVEPEPDVPAYNGVELFHIDKTEYEVGEPIMVTFGDLPVGAQFNIKHPTAPQGGGWAWCLVDGSNASYGLNKNALPRPNASGDLTRVVQGTFAIVPGEYTIVVNHTGTALDDVWITFTVVEAQGGEDDGGDDEPDAPTYNGVELFHIDKKEYVVGEPIMVTFGDLPAGAQFNIKHPTAPQGGGWAWCLVDGSNASYGLNKNVLPRPNSSGDLTQVVQGTFAIVPGEYTVVVNKTGTSLDDVWITFTVVEDEGGETPEPEAGIVGVEGQFTLNKTVFASDETIIAKAAAGTQAWLELHVEQNGAYAGYGWCYVGEGNIPVDEEFDLRDVVYTTGSAYSFVPGKYKILWYPTGGYDDPVAIEFEIQ